MRIRGYRPDDLDALYAVSLATGDAGGDAAAQYRDRRLLGHVYVGPYAALFPGLVLVAEDAGGVAGYILGALDTGVFEARAEAEWWPALRAAHRDPAGVPPAERTADQQRQHRFHHPLRMPEAVLREYPSHLHVNLLPRLQGRGVGGELVRRWLALAVAGGSHGVHLGVNARNTRALGFYRAVGFGAIATEVPGAPLAVWFARRLPGAASSAIAEHPHHQIEEGQRRR